MRLAKFRVTNYRSVRDSGWCEVETDKTILVGPNEAGKTALLQALQQINPPKEVRPFHDLRDYPRSEYNDITTGQVDPTDVPVVEAHFILDEADVEALPDGFRQGVYVCVKSLANEYTHRLEGAPKPPNLAEIDSDLIRLATHITKREEESAALDKLTQLKQGWGRTARITKEKAVEVRAWLDWCLPSVDEDDAKEEQRIERLRAACELAAAREEALSTLWKRRPRFVLFSNYFRVRPRIHLDHLATRLATGVLDDDQYDYGNSCLLKLLGFTAKELADLGRVSSPQQQDKAALERYQDQLDKRHYQLNAASVRLSKHINDAWQPDKSKGEASKLHMRADQQYLKVVVEDGLGVEVELDQRSEGFQWLVSFYVVFFAEAQGDHENAILLLDEPGLSLHGLKQREFRNTLSHLATSNQTIFTTHSPFLVGPDELDMVRVVEMTDRETGTKVHTSLTAGDSAALLPLQEALGYDLAQSLFAQSRNLILEGLTDLWYIEATANLLAEAGFVVLNPKIALVPADGAGKVAYFATILHAHKLKVAALLDSDAAGENAAKQEVLVHTLRNKGVLRTRDAYSGAVGAPEVEDLLRDTLLVVAKEQLGVDATAEASRRPSQGVLAILASKDKSISKYRLAKAYVQWTRSHEAADLTQDERDSWEKLISLINKALK